jgi:hypothetical protein
MSTDLEDPIERTASSLLSGILSDLQHLVDQQFHLMRREVEVEVRQRAAAGTVFGVGVGILFLAAIALCLTLSHLLHSVASPPGSDPAWLPLWACHAVVAVVLAAIGGTIAHVGRSRFRSIDPYQNSATEILEEHAP